MPSKKEILKKAGYVPVIGRPAIHKKAVSISFRCPRDLEQQLPAKGGHLRTAWLISAIKSKINSDKSN